MKLLPTYLAVLFLCFLQSGLSECGAHDERDLIGKRLSELQAKKVEPANIKFVSLAFRYMSYMSSSQVRAFKTIDKRYGIKESSKDDFDKALALLVSTIQKDAPLRERMSKFESDAYKPGREVKLVYFDDTEWEEEYLVVTEGDRVINSLQWSKSKEIKTEQ
jgi:hypothetical protein